jgi:membrane protein implicated in regulation of membrane protease activity
VNLDSPETWRWIWFVMAGVFVISELATPAAFFFLPFAIGAAAAGLMCVLDAGITVSWITFLAVSVIAFAGLWKLGRKFDQADVAQEGVGATRWVGQEARVVEAIPEGGIGAVRLEREEWRAESLTGTPVAVSTTVVVTRVAGTRLVVAPVDRSAEPAGPRDNTSQPGAE